VVWVRLFKLGFGENEEHPFVPLNTCSIMPSLTTGLLGTLFPFGTLNQKNSTKTPKPLPSGTNANRVSDGG